MFAIQNIKTGKFLYGTDYRYRPYHQRTHGNKMITYENLSFAKADFMSRRCNKDYRIVCLKRIEINHVIEFNDSNGYQVEPGDMSEYGGSRI